ncbi:sensor histidine kinase KdpD [uncultured Adlercreutzia sp.]|uniref:sensor histidine kinase n=1 Tax=uncultured Adlercreutzia sp. TaxID=875803 RepID=UPI0026F40523|nr:HAMP domain-containing sensor histidine kinase [uncultured Adlercreutzia sp.]
MALAICFGGLATCAFVVLALYGRELRRMARWLRDRDRSSNGRLATEMPGPGFAELARAVNDSLDETAAEERQAAADQRQFQRDLASLSHDIRTPLMGAKGYVSLAADEPDAARRAHYLASAEMRLADMEGLLDALFQYARANDPERELDLQLVAVLPLLARTLAGQFPAFEERGWEPQVAFEDEALTVEADPEALARIFENLVGNVLAHGAAAPTITQHGRTLIFANAVADPDAIDPTRLFERFYRADAARASQGAPHHGPVRASSGPQGTPRADAARGSSRAGTGLGLAVAKSLAEAMAIQISATLTPASDAPPSLAITLTFH